MKSKKFYLDGENFDSLKEGSLEIAKTVNQLLEEFNTSEAESTYVFINDEESHVDKNKTLEEINHDEKVDIFCHRCKKIDIKVFYQNRTYDLIVSSNLKGKIILKKALKEFEIPNSESVKLKLVANSANGPTILDNDRIGKFVSYPDCSINIYLVSKDNWQG